jgi:hypothetical protein
MVMHGLATVRFIVFNLYEYSVNIPKVEPRPTVLSFKNGKKHKYGTMCRVGFENAMRDRSPREFQTARPLILYVYEHTAAIFLELQS